MQTAKIQQRPAPPLECHGKLVAWSRDGSKITASGDSFSEVKAKALAAGEGRPRYERIPPADARFIGNLAWTFPIFNTPYRTDRLPLFIALSSPSTSRDRTAKSIEPQLALLRECEANPGVQGNERFLRQALRHRSCRVVRRG